MLQIFNNYSFISKHLHASSFWIHIRMHTLKKRFGYEMNQLTRSYFKKKLNQALKSKYLFKLQYVSSHESFWIVNDFEFLKKIGNCQIAAKVTSSVAWICCPKLKDHDWKLRRRFKPRLKFLELMTESWSKKLRYDRS